jgi:iron-sulfur cluster repair protein YtfE (RIC family)
MKNRENWLLHEHLLYENLLSRCQYALEIEDWEDVSLAFGELVRQLELHMAMEEQVLYPLYESSPRVPQEPTRALRLEHARIMRLSAELERVIRSRDAGHVHESLNHLEYQLIKHHEKEEDIFLPMAGSILEHRHEEISRRLAEFAAAQAEGSQDG